MSARDEKIGDMEVPSVVKEAADKAVPGAKWESADVTYQLEGKDGKGRTVTIELESDGDVVEIETEISEREVPSAVMKALKAKYPKFSIATILELKHEGKVSGYQFEGKRPSGKEEVTILVSADGKSVDLSD